jgi:hypothetical protein
LPKTTLRRQPDFDHAWHHQFIARPLPELKPSRGHRVLATLIQDLQ